MFLEHRFEQGVPILNAVIDRFDELALRGTALARLSVFVYAPVCAGRQFRGRGVVRELYRAARAQAARFDGVGFIARENPRSYAAHAQGLAMASIGEFRFNRKDYWIVAFRVRA